MVRPAVTGLCLSTQVNGQTCSHRVVFVHSGEWSDLSHRVVFVHSGEWSDLSHRDVCVHSGEWSDLQSQGCVCPLR